MVLVWGWFSKDSSRGFQVSVLLVVSSIYWNLQHFERVWFSRFCLVVLVVSSVKINGEHPGDHHHQDFPKSTAIQMGDVLQYKWEAYCDTNGRSTDTFPFRQSVGAPKVLQYKLEAYCDTNRRCIAILL